MTVPALALYDKAKVHFEDQGYVFLNYSNFEIWKPKRITQLDKFIKKHAAKTVGISLIGLYDYSTRKPWVRRQSP